MKIGVVLVISSVFIKGLLGPATSMAAEKAKALPVAQVKIVHYPQVLSYSGNIFIQSGLETKFRKAKVKEILREKAIIKTEANSRLDLGVDSERTLTILESSEVEIPSIAWDSGQFTEVLLRDGEIMWQQSGAPGNNITLKSPVFEVSPPIGISGFSYDEEKILAEAKIYAGAMEFSALNAETTVILTAGKSVKFKGVKEDGAVAYDVLLKGRKSPQGHLQSIESLPESVMRAYSATAVAERKRADLQKIIRDKAKKETLQVGQICAKPGGKLNECSWSCLQNPKHEKNNCLANNPGVSCVRRRCNANGIWGEETTLDAGAALLKCKAKPFVTGCDY